MNYQPYPKYSPVLFVALLLLAGPFVTFGNAQGGQAEAPQITDVAKELNESFADPDVKQWVERFEREGRYSYA